MARETGDRKAIATEKWKTIKNDAKCVDKRMEKMLAKRQPKSSRGGEGAEATMHNRGTWRNILKEAAVPLFF